MLSNHQPEGPAVNFVNILILIAIVAVIGGAWWAITKYRGSTTTGQWPSTGGGGTDYPTDGSGPRRPRSEDAE
ncbi:MAG TPA: hypothetical protein PK788_12105 [Gemmatimonadaceae bacterium]|nr:hypothetical protein [Gemmatimonadaceae bacterium]